MRITFLRYFEGGGKPLKDKLLAKIANRIKQKVRNVMKP